MICYRKFTPRHEDLLQMPILTEEWLVLLIPYSIPQIATFVGPTWGPPGSCRPQMGPMLAPWTLLSRTVWCPNCPGGIHAVWWTTIRWTASGVVVNCKPISSMVDPSGPRPIGNLSGNLSILYTKGRFWGRCILCQLHVNLNLSKKKVTMNKFPYLPHKNTWTDFYNFPEHYIGLNL